MEETERYGENGTTLTRSHGDTGNARSCHGPRITQTTRAGVRRAALRAAAGYA
jgi:hypothetical protein